MKYLRGLPAVFAAIAALAAPALATTHASFSVAVTRSATSMVSISQDVHGVLKVSGSLAPSANSAAIVGIYTTTADGSRDATSALLATSRDPDGSIVVNARLSLAALLEASGADRSSVAGLIVVASAT